MISILSKKRVLSSLLFVFINIGVQAAPVADSPAQQLFNQALYYISLYYYGYTPINNDKFAKDYQAKLDTSCQKQPNCPYSTARSLINQMVNSLNDGHTGFISQEEIEITKEDPKYLKIGVTIAELDNGSLLINGIIDGSPADKVGLNYGDIITAINEHTSNLDNSGLYPFLQQSVRSGQAFRLSVQRNGKNFIVQLQGVKINDTISDLPRLYTVGNKIGLIKIPTFSEYKVGETVHNLVRRAQSAGINKLIIDLRDNPGGFAKEAIIASGAFLQKSGMNLQGQGGKFNLIWENGKYTEKFGNFSQDPIKIGYNTIWNKPVEILINQQTASAAEVFAHFLQTNKKIKIFGQESTGIGNTARDEYELLDGSKLIITTARSFELSGKPLPSKIIPDFNIKDELLTTGKDTVLSEAVRFLNTQP